MTSIEARKLAVLATLMASDIPPPPDPLPYGWPINSTHLTRLITDPEYASRKVDKKKELAILERLWGDYMNRNRAAVGLSTFDEAQGMSEKAAEQRDQQSGDEKPLLQIDWSPENRRMPTQPLTEEQNKLPKIPMTGWNKKERDMARVLFHNDLFEYDSDATEEEAQPDKEDGRPDLSTYESKSTPPARQKQIQEFMEMYIRQYCIRETWEEEVEKIPYASLLEHALEKRQSVVDLLHEYRPRLYTDEISMEDREMGVEFLQELNFPGAIERFLEITGQDLVDFFRLDIEWVFIQEAIDKQQIMTAGQLGWIDLEKVLKSLLAKPPSSVPVLSRYPFLGTKKARIPAQLVEDSREDPDGTEDVRKVLPDKGIRPLEKGKEPAGPESEDEDLENSPHVPLPLSYLIPGPLGEHPRPVQRDVLLMASQRMFPDAYKRIQGFATSTLLEQKRKPLATSSAYCPRGFHLHAKQLLGGIVGRKMEVSMDGAAVGHEDLPRERSTSDEMGEPSGRGQTQSRTAENLSHGPRGLEPQRHTILSFRDADIHDPIWFDASPSPSLGSVNSNATGRASQHGQRHHHGPQDGAFISAPPGFTSNLFGNPIEPVIHLPLLPKQDVPVVETAHLNQLRQMLDTKYGSIIREKKKKWPTGQALTTRHRASLEAEDDDDETEYEDAMDLPIILPEPEKDEEYDPKKKAPKRAPRQRASRKTGRKVGRPRKQTTKNDEGEEAALMEQTGDSEAQKKAQSVVETTEKISIQEYNAPEHTNTIATPMKGPAGDSPASNGPPSSGRIKLLVKSSQKDATSTNSNSTRDPITGVPLNQPLTPTRTPMARVYHASSASHAVYAAEAGRARFAHTANRIAQPPGKAVTPNVSYELGKLHQLSKTYESIKMGDAQDADRAEFAAKADRAEYAEKADEANFALRIERTGHQHGNT
ncbi:uncharacterized protein FTOL_08901 [Fusarium torulosum]|uniref:Uncharacterized protein n=1 Tax=Fusarium torulosum TaxID=33205 RepID=A0AAE8MDI5_9HYPO|nr:uncharacterized protein FTOL_08901 [Fusarium torulosum]